MKNLPLPLSTETVVHATPFAEVKITGCSMGCLYATGPIDECHCTCKGETHGLMSGKLISPARCTPSAEARCKEGTEGTECRCACKGVNHALYAGISDYKISHFTL